MGIHTLIAKDFRFQECFVELGAYRHLKQVHAMVDHIRTILLYGESDFYKLLSASRNALVCVEENIINKVAKEVARMLLHSTGPVPPNHLIISHIMLLNLFSVVDRCVQYGLVDPDSLTLMHAL